MTCQLQNFTVEIVGLLLDGLPCLKQRADHRDQLWTILDQLLGPHSKNIELGTANHETDVLEQATDLVLEITLDLDQQRPARQQRPNRVAIDIFDAHLLKPAGLHDAGDPGSIIAVALIDLHFEYRLGVARSIQITGRPSRLSSVHSHVAVGPVSRPTRIAPGAFDLTNTAIA